MHFGDKLTVTYHDSITFYADYQYNQNIRNNHSSTTIDNDKTIIDTNDEKGLIIMITVM